MRRAARVDDNHAEIKLWLKQLNFSVLDLSRVGGGVYDLLIARNQDTALVEVKMPAGKLRESQIKFRRRWKGKMFVARSMSDCVAISKAMK